MRAATAILVLALGVAGCGGGDDEGSSKPSPAAGKSAAPAAKATTVTIKDFEYAPTELTVAGGGKVTWTNQDSANHTVTFDDKAVKSIDNIRQGQKQSITFDTAGEFAYECAYHPNMHGTVIVK